MRLIQRAHGVDEIRERRGEIIKSKEEHADAEKTRKPRIARITRMGEEQFVDAWNHSVEVIKEGRKNEGVDFVLRLSLRHPHGSGYTAVPFSPFVLFVRFVVVFLQFLPW